MIATIVILGIALTTVTSMMVNSLSSGANTFEETRTTALARAYLDEILSRRFDENSHPSGVPACDGIGGSSGCTDDGSVASNDFGPDSGENSRDKWDDVDDYDGLDEGEGGVIADLHDAENNVRSGYSDYRVQVSVVYAGDIDPVNKDKTDAKLITVTVYTPPAAIGTEFQVYKANF